MFRTFVAKIMSLQKQLYPQYHTNTFLHDRLLTAVDIPAIHTKLMVRLPRTSSQAVNRISNQLSDKKSSAGSSAACLMEEEEDDEETSMYNSLGKTYGGDARRKIKKPWSSGQRRPVRGGFNQRLRRPLKKSLSRG